MSWRLAQLVKRKYRSGEGKCLELVLMEKTAEKPSKIKGLSSTPLKKVISVHPFYDLGTDPAMEVLMGFRIDHSSIPSMGDVRRRKGYVYLTYLVEQESVMSLALARYGRHDH